MSQSEIILDYKQFKEMPYNTTDVSVAKTKLDIEKLLTDYEVIEKAWIDTQTDSALMFTLMVEVQNTRRKLAFKFSPTMIRVNYKRKKNELKTKASWRLFYWYLKSKLEAIKYGLVSIEKELMSNVIISGNLTDNRTVGDTLSDAIAMGKLEKISQYALEDRSEESEGRKKIDVDYTIKEDP